MNTSTAYNHKVRLQSRLESIFSASECYHWTHAHILEQIKVVYDDPAIKRCPGWVFQSLTNYSSARFERILRGLVLWLHDCGTGPKSWELLTDAERAMCSQKDFAGSNHYWLSETTGVGTIADKNVYQACKVISRTFLITNKKF